MLLMPDCDKKLASLKQFVSRPAGKKMHCLLGTLRKSPISTQEIQGGLSIIQSVSLERAAAIEHRKRNISQFVETDNRKTIIKNPPAPPPETHKEKLQIWVVYALRIGRK